MADQLKMLWMNILVPITISDLTTTISNASQNNGDAIFDLVFILPVPREILIDSEEIWDSIFQLWRNSSRTTYPRSPLCTGRPL